MPMMRFDRWIYGIAALLLAAGIISVPVAAESFSAAQDQALVVAIIDVQSISRDAKATQSVQKKLESLRKSYQKNIAAQQEVLRKAEQELAENRNKMTPEELAAKSKDFEKQVATLHGRVQKRKSALEAAHSKAMQTFQAELVKQVSSYAEENGIDVVLRRSEVFLAGRDLDITEEILARLNKVLPEIDVTIPKP